MVENGQRADENHVSRMSSSCLRFCEWHFGHSVGSSRETIISPQSQYQTGIR